MSGVYVNGMKMPDICGLCPFSDIITDEWINQLFCSVTGSNIVTQGERLNDCPLVEVPEHGDLIDRDMVRKEMDRHYPFDQFTQSLHGIEDIAKGNMIRILASSSIIIPADKEGEG